MELSLWITLYLAVAAFATVSTFYAGVLNGRSEKLFTTREYALITFACIGVGLLWVLFVPGLGVFVSRRHGATLVESWRRAFVQALAARARG